MHMFKIKEFKYVNSKFEKRCIGCDLNKKRETTILGIHLVEYSLNGFLYLTIYFHTNAATTNPP